MAPGHVSNRPLGDVVPGAFCVLSVLVGLLPITVCHHLVGNSLGEPELDEGLDLVGHHLIASSFNGCDDVFYVGGGTLNHRETVPPSASHETWTAGSGARKASYSPYCGRGIRSSFAR